MHLAFVFIVIYSFWATVELYGTGFGYMDNTCWQDTFIVGLVMGFVDNKTNIQYHQTYTYT